MDYTHLGRSGLRVSRVCLGTMNFGPQTDEPDAHAVLDLEVVPACEQYGVGLIPWSPLNRGVLGGILRKQQEGRSADESTQALLERHRPAVEAYEAFCSELGADPAHVGLAWLLAQPAVTAPIVGPRTADQLTGALQALDVHLGEDELARLDEIFPGPGGAAPEAYAW